MRLKASRVETERLVLDSYALLALLEGGAAGERIKELVGKATDGRCQLFMSVVNLGEVLYIIERERGLPKAQEALARIDELPIRIVDVERGQVLAAAHIKAQWPVAYADCFAVALAQSHGATIVTGDLEFKQLEAASVIPIAWLATE